MDSINIIILSLMNYTFIIRGNKRIKFSYLHILADNNDDIGNKTIFFFWFNILLDGQK